MYDGLWLKSVLIPLWVIQIILTVLFAVSVIFILILAGEEQGQIQDENDYNYGPVIGVAVVYLVIAVVSLIFNITEIVFFARKRLNPVMVVVFTAIMTAVWLAILIVAVVGATRTGAFLGFIWIIILVTSILAKLIYCSVILARHRKNQSRGSYAPAQTETGLGYPSSEPTSTALNAFNHPQTYPPPVAQDSYYAPGAYNDMTSQAVRAK